MFKPKKLLLLSLVLSLSFLLLSLPAFLFAEESITIATYYPSPYGSYNQLQTSTLGVGDNNDNGSLDSGDVPDPATNPGDIWIKGQIKIAGGSPGTNKVLTSDANGLASWESITPSLGYPSHHTASDCITAGGTVVPADGTVIVCRFNAANCPGSWAAYKNWSTTQSNTCNYNGNNCGNPPPCPTSCTAVGHAWSDAGIIESCKYLTECNWPMSSECGYCSATRTQIGCY